MPSTFLPRYLFRIFLGAGGGFFVPTAAAITSGSESVDAISGGSYRTFRLPSHHLHFDVELERLARSLAPRFENYLDGLQSRLKFRLKRPMPVFLVKRGFGNAFVTFPSAASPSFSVLSPRLTAAELGSPTFLYAGDDEGVFDTFRHEAMHYVEEDQRRSFWSALMGDAPYSLPSGTAWAAEAWAVVHEKPSNPYSGRMKESYFGALMRANVSGRATPAPTEWDLSANNPDWRLLGSHYVVGSNFFAFLARTHGLAKVDDFMIHRNGFSASSAYEKSFGKDFEALYGEFRRETADEVRRQSASGAAVVFDDDIGRINALGTTLNGEKIFVGSSLDRTPRLYRVSADGKRDLGSAALFEWIAPLGGRLAFAPWQWSEARVPGALDFFSAESNAEGNESRPGLYRYHLEAGTRRRLRGLPLARAAVSRGDRAGYYALVQSDPNENRFRLEEGPLDEDGPTRVLSEWSEFSSVSQLRQHPESGALYFAAIRPEGSWGIYRIDANPNATPQPLVDTRGQDLFPLVDRAGNVFFLSDLNGRSFQVYRLDGERVCRLSDEPFFVSSFGWGANERELLAVSRRGPSEVLVSLSTEARNCVSMAEVAAASTSVPSFRSTTVAATEESAWQGLWPATRALLPRYTRSGDFGVQALLSGESPYKDWSWTLLGDWEATDENTHILGGTIGWHAFFPVVSRLRVEASPLALGYAFVPDARFLNASLELQRELGHHLFRGRAVATTQTDDAASDPDPYGSATEIGVAHSFSNTQQSALAAAPQRGWSLSTAFEVNPSYFGQASTRAVLSARQTFHLPIESFARNHSLSLSLSETKAFNGLLRVQGIGGGNGFDYEIESAVAQGYGFGRLVGAGETLFAYPDFRMTANLILRGTLAYVIPLNFLRSGLSQVAGRRWLNPETSAMNVSFFYDTTVARDGDIDVTEQRGSVGIRSDWSLWLNENQSTGISASYIGAFELQDERALRHTFATSARIYY